MRHQCNRALALWKLGRVDEALPLMRDAYQRNPKDVTTACNLGLLLSDMDRFDDAVLIYRALPKRPMGTIVIGGAATRRQEKQLVENLRNRLIEKGVIPK